MLRILLLSYYMSGRFTGEILRIYTLVLPSLKPVVLMIAVFNHVHVVEIHREEEIVTLILPSVFLHKGHFCAF